MLLLLLLVVILLLLRGGLQSHVSAYQSEQERTHIGIHASSDCLLLGLHLHSLVLRLCLHLRIHRGVGHVLRRCENSQSTPTSLAASQTNRNHSLPLGWPEPGPPEPA